MLGKKASMCAHNAWTGGNKHQEDVPTAFDLWFLILWSEFAAITLEFSFLNTMGMGMG